ncbi:hypothetical protein [Zoogloea sp.]|jgi:hypothetical protein
MDRETLRGWWLRNRGRVIGLLLVCVFFFLLGRFSHTAVSPLMCKIYG